MPRTSTRLPELLCRSVALLPAISRYVVPAPDMPECAEPLVVPLWPDCDVPLVFPAEDVPLVPAPVDGVVPDVPALVPVVEPLPLVVPEVEP